MNNDREVREDRDDGFSDDERAHLEQRAEYGAQLLKGTDPRSWMYKETWAGFSNEELGAISVVFGWADFVINQGGVRAVDDLDQGESEAGA